MTYSGFFDLGFLYWLENLRNPILDEIMLFFTHFGEELYFMIVALVVLWCIDKRKGYYLLSIGFIGTIINQFLKLWFRVPRPWVKDPNFTIVERARSSAGGYSFPSGHTQNVVGTFGGLARSTKRHWVRWVCVAILLLTSFSRMYLGCHTLADVGVSFVIALILVFALYPLFQSMDEHPNRMYGVLAAFLAIALGYVLFLKLYSFPSDLEESKYLGSLKNAYTLLGALLGLLVVYPIEGKYIHYETKAIWWAQILKVVLGLIGTLIVKEGLKTVFRAVFGTALFPDLLRYFCLVLFAGLVWPCTFRFWSRLGQKKER